MLAARDVRFDTQEVTRVCLFTDSLAPSGVGEHMLTLAAELNGYEVTLVCPPTQDGNRLLQRAADVGFRTLPLQVRDRAEAERFARWLEDERIDLFHCHAGIAIEGHPGLRAAAEAVPAIVRTEHLAEMSVVFPLEQLRHLVNSPYYRRDRLLSHAELVHAVADVHGDYLRKVACVDQIICVSEGVRDSFARVGVDEHRLTVVRNGIHPRTPGSSPAEVRRRLGVPADRRIVVTVGRFVDVKGYPQLLRAARHVASAAPDVMFVWMGSGPLEPELRAEVDAAGLSEVVLFAGERADVPEVLSVAELFVLPSLVEGLPLVVLEAMAAELPVVATRVSGTREVVVDGVTGRLVPPGALDGGGDGTALAGAILDVLADPDEAASYGKAGRLRLEHEFTAERMARETTDVYEAVLARNAVGGRRH